jgi:hypothetical protein
MGGNWIILRTSGRTTIRLAETLSEDGYEAWTPVETRTVRIPRHNVRRTVRLPIMPSYVFARSDNLIDLIQLANLKFKPRRHANRPAHADFSVMHYHDRIPAIADDQLQSLRQLEAKRTPRIKAQQRFAEGVSVRVKIEGGSFAGMKGRVERSDYGTTLVCFDSRISVKIDTSLLLNDEVIHVAPCIGLAA